MPNRLTMRAGDWESIFGRLEELVLANSGENEFAEVFKLLIAKIWAERSGSEDFRGMSSPAATAKAIDGLLARAAGQWRGVLDDNPAMRLLPEHLQICVEALEGYSLTDSSFEVLDGVFEFLVSRNAKGAKGQYFTPRHVIEACVRIMAPSPADMVIDPACGSGGFLVHTFNYVRTRHQDALAGDYASRMLWGFDIDQRAIQVAKALMVIAGNGAANILRVNSLFKQEYTFRQMDLLARENSVPAMSIDDVMKTRVRGFRGFDVLLTNPPFAGEIREPLLLNSYELAHKRDSIERDILFMERCVDLLRPGGRIAIVMPQGKLNADRWGYAREWLVRRVRIVAVLGLGRETFMPHTAQKADVLFGRKRERPVTVPTPEDILFLVSERSGKDRRGRVVVRGSASVEDGLWDRADHDLSEIVETFERFVEGQGISWRTE